MYHIYIDIHKAYRYEIHVKDVQDVGASRYIYIYIHIHVLFLLFVFDPQNLVLFCVFCCIHIYIHIYI